MKRWESEQFRFMNEDFRFKSQLLNLSNYSMSTDRIVGIDLGTTNSLVAFMQGDTPVVIPGEDGVNLVPSVVALDEKDQIIVGNAARKYLIETPERAVYSIKRLMGRGIEDIQRGIEAVSVSAGR